jgi:hypothetical protein
MALRVEFPVEPRVVVFPSGVLKADPGPTLSHPQLGRVAPGWSVEALYESTVTSEAYNWIDVSIGSA